MIKKCKYIMILIYSLLCENFVHVNSQKFARLTQFELFQIF